MQPELSIIIVNWNSKDYVRKCIHSIYASTHGIAFEILVVDGGSFDGCAEMLAKEFPEVLFIQCEKNVGFAKANNLGYERSSGDCLLFLNPDTEVIGPAINLLRSELLRLDEAGIVGAKLLNTDGSLQTSCVQPFPTIFNQLLDAEALRRAFPRHSFWGMEALLSGSGLPQPVQMLSGACLMMRRSVFVQVGRFNEHYFLYAEDLDLCYQVHCAGWRNYFVPSAVIVHHGGGSSQKSTFSDVMMRESVYRFLRKVRGRWYGVGFRFSMVIGAFGRLSLLALIFPVKIIRGEALATIKSFSKWSAILRWALGLRSLALSN